MRSVKGKRKLQHRLNAAFNEPKRIKSLSVEIAVRRESVFGKVLLRIRVINRFSPAINNNEIRIYKHTANHGNYLFQSCVVN